MKRFTPKTWAAIRCLAANLTVIAVSTAGWRHSWEAGLYGAVVAGSVILMDAASEGWKKHREPKPEPIKAEQIDGVAARVGFTNGDMVVRVNGLGLRVDWHPDHGPSRVEHLYEWPLVGDSDTVN